VGPDGRVNGPGDPPDPDRPAPSPRPRVPRPGDPFARAAGPAGHATSARPPRKHRRGRRFFLFLLTTGAVLTVGTFVLVYYFGNMPFHHMTIEFYHDVVVPRGIPEALPPDYPKADAVRLVKALDDFFARADQGGIGDDAVIAVIARIEKAMADKRITPEEAEDLIATAHRAEREGAVPSVPGPAPGIAPGTGPGGGEG